jgi:ornithine cyclodeaminase/alanine dehydrogenase-like protein (mu-crystallin family)
MTAADVPPLRYLSSADVTAAMPPLDERLALAERTMTALVRDAQLPPKIGVHPRPAESFAHAMPAHLRDADGDVADDLLGMKWIAGFPSNASRGLAAIHGLVILNDATTGIPKAILDAGPVTAERTAAVSGVAVARFGPTRGPQGDARGRRVALIGAGVQARSHLAVLGRTVPGADLVVFDRHTDRAEALAAHAATTPGIASASVSSSARDAADGADIVVTVASFAPPAERQVLVNDWLTRDALVVAVDYATYVAASVAASAALFVVDERGQFLANREAGNFDGYPDPATTLGEAILDGTPRPTTGRVVVTHLGVGLADLVFGDAILRRAVELGIGTTLRR